MASANYNKPPPAISSCKSYTDWKKLINIWKSLTSLDTPKQGPALVLSLEGEAQEAALEIPSADLTAEEGIETILNRLDTLYAKYQLSEKYNALEAFETYRRPNNLPIRNFLIEFEKRYSKVKSVATTMSDDLLAFRLLKSANLNTSHEQLVKATVSELNFDQVKTKLTKIFTDESEIPSADFKELNIKQETFQTQHQSSYYEHDSAEDDSEFQEEDTLYTDSKRRFQKGQNRGKYTPSNRGRNIDRSNANSSNWRTDRNDDRRPNFRFAKNPTDRNGKITRCSICDSVNHWVSTCPDKEIRDNDTLLVHEIILHQNEHNDPEQLKNLVAETWSSGLLDCGASKTVCGEIWLEEYIGSLSESDRKSVTHFPSSSIYRFGDGEKIQAHQAVKIPAHIGHKALFISVDIIQKDIPLLLSKSFMKQSNMILDFTNDTLSAFGQLIPLTTTMSGHYTLPINKPKQLIMNLSHTTSQITLSLRSKLSNRDIARKLHRQFAHPSKEKLMELISRAGNPWNSNDELKSEIESITSNCETCQKYKKSPPRPVVGLPMATQFLETVAMDLKFYRGTIILHLIDVCTRLSAAIVVANKQPDTIIQALFQIWISVYGSTEKFLTDNGGEFANAKFINVGEKFGIAIKTTAAYSPWSNGMIERHNLTLANMLDKVLSDTSCSINTALAWCINAKNSLSNVHGFSPYQLAIGTNPRLPSTLTDNLPALTTDSTSKSLSENLQALHKAREAFIQCENSERIRRALSHNIRTSGDIKYVSGDSVFFKRDSSTEWHGPAKVLGQDGQQVLVKHGSYYVRIHPCRLRLTQQSKIYSGPDSTSVSETKKVDNQTKEDKKNQPEKCDDDEDDHSTIVALAPPEQSENQEDATQSTSNPITVIRSSSSDMPHSTDRSPLDNPPMVEEPKSPSKQDPLDVDSNQSIKLKPGLNVKYKNFAGDVVRATIISRAGRAKGKYAKWWNTNRIDGTQEAIDFSLIKEIEVDHCEGSEPEKMNPEEDQVQQILSVNAKEDIRRAKSMELLQWKVQNVYTEVCDINQDCVSLRWVIQPKIIDGQPSVKARLCARGFEEEQNFRTDSPTCSREGVRIALTLIASNSWSLNSLDVKTAFLQGRPIEREVYVKPPKEAETNKIWKLNKTVYGLADASRSWYLKLRDELIRLGGTPLQLDQGIFTWYDGNSLIGIVICFVDDVLWGGSQKFKPYIIQLKEVFHIGTESSQNFNYIGVNLKQNEDFSITISQNEYTNSLQPVLLDKKQSSDKNRMLTDEERTLLRGALGQLNWLAGMSRPEISFSVSDVSSRIRSSVIADIMLINKVIKFVKNTSGFITIPKLDIRSVKIASFSDASFNNLHDGGSQGGYAVFLYDKYNKSAIISWSSNRVKRVVRSTLASETLSFTEGTDTGFFLSQLLQEILYKQKTRIECYTDSRSLFETVGTTKLISDKRLRVEISAIRQMVDRGEITIHWVNKERQLSDVLTKAGASHIPLMEAVQSGLLQQ